MSKYDYYNISYVHHEEEEEIPKNLEQEISMTKSVREDSQYSQSRPYNFNMPNINRTNMNMNVVKQQRNNFIPNKMNNTTMSNRTKSVSRIKTARTIDKSNSSNMIRQTNSKSKSNSSSRERMTNPYFKKYITFILTQNDK